MIGSPVDIHGLLGAWQLVSVRSQFEDTGEMVDIHGPAPRGFAVFCPDGRMMVIIAESGERPNRAVTAYTGRFDAKPDRLVTKVDVAWHPAWEGSEQHRFLSIQGDKLLVQTQLQDHPLLPGRMHRTIVTWAREHRGIRRQGLPP
ncbi:lipocalin-like domain-containing protein [Dankookia sp. GCM10030260]|uniref:lipocalin-like domain-containing protein n=1 Tax=Dankookia sp. GCM10030260 TaxID=3273390 RepID=UPI0036D4161A